MNISCGCPVACAGRKESVDYMGTPAAYQVVITTSHGLNIILTNKQEIYFRSFSHFVTAADAEKFAVNLAQTLEKGTYTELDRCSICGQAFTRQNRLTLLKDGRVIHGTCFWDAFRRRELAEDDCKIRRYRIFPKDTPAFDYSNIGYEEKTRSFRYAIQIVSKSAIHLHLIEPNRSMKHQFCLTYDECHGLIREIQVKLAVLKRYLDAAVGKCAFCGYPIYVDKNHYELESGEVIHGVCMERFIRSPASAGVRFPATLVLRQDVFGHARACGESFDPYLFPDTDND